MQPTVMMCLWRIQTNFVYCLARLLRTVRLLQDKLKADELAKDKIEAKKVPHFEDHVPPHIIQPKVFVTIQLCADVLTIAAIFLAHAKIHEVESNKPNTTKFLHLKGREDNACGGTQVSYRLCVELVISEISFYNFDMKSELLDCHCSLIFVYYMFGDKSLGTTKAVERPETSSDAIGNEDSLASWSPFLLAHLRGQDNIITFTLEDNELWLGHLFGPIERRQRKWKIHWDQCRVEVYSDYEMMAAAGEAAEGDGVI
ncbi:gamma thionin [Tanacetum coccineum]